jgi:hypothetical protein
MSSKEVSFDLIKSNFFRGVHADGVWGGITPQGLFAFTFYNERFPIPKRVTHVMGEDGMLGPEEEELRVSRSGIIREAEVCVYMDPQVARALRDFLTERLQKLDEINQEQKRREK